MLSNAYTWHSIMMKKRLKLVSLCRGFAVSHESPGTYQSLHTSPASALRGSVGISSIRHVSSEVQSLRGHFYRHLTRGSQLCIRADSHKASTFVAHHVGYELWWEFVLKLGICWWCHRARPGCSRVLATATLQSTGKAEASKIQDQCRELMRHSLIS
jgi:hypothetical protein